MERELNKLFNDTSIIKQIDNKRDMINQTWISKLFWGVYIDSFVSDSTTVYVVIFAVVLFSRISRVGPRENFHFRYGYYGNITKITKLSHQEFPYLVQHLENICTRNILPYTVFTVCQQSCAVAMIRCSLSIRSTTFSVNFSTFLSP